MEHKQGIEHRYGHAQYLMSRNLMLYFFLSREADKDLLLKDVEKLIKKSKFQGLSKPSFSILDRGPNAWISLLTDDQEHVIAYARGSLVKEMGFPLKSFSPEVQYIDFVHVHPEYQGKGLCRTLMKYTMEQLYLHGFKKVALDNTAGEVGYRCYTESSSPHYNFKTDKRKKIIRFNMIQSPVSG